MKDETQHRLRRSKRDRIIGGVCGGLGDFLGLNPWIFRIIFLILIPAPPMAVLPYILLWIIIPSE